MANKNKPTQADVNDAMAVYHDKTTNPKEKAAMNKILKNASSVQIDKAEKLSKTREKGMKGGGKINKPIKYAVGGSVKPAWMRNR
tara:strand:+ start:1214 stop:1468 length:255 start_codon:yes stop_codon:yes gene_type:complete